MDKNKKEVNIEYEVLEGEIKIQKKYFCDRCGNDLVKGKYFWHFPFIKLYIALCHICYLGFIYGFYNDVSHQLKELKNG